MRLINQLLFILSFLVSAICVSNAYSAVTWATAECRVALDLLPHGTETYLGTGTISKTKKDYDPLTGVIFTVEGMVGTHYSHSADLRTYYWSGTAWVLRARYSGTIGQGYDNPSRFIPTDNLTTLLSPQGCKTCDSEELQAQEECGEKGYDIDPETCEYTCHCEDLAGSQASSYVEDFISADVFSCNDGCQVRADIEELFNPLTAVMKLITNWVYTGSPCSGENPFNPDPDDPEKCDRFEEQCNLSCGGEDNVAINYCSEEDAQCHCKEDPDNTPECNEAKRQCTASCGAGNVLMFSCDSETGASDCECKVKTPEQENWEQACEESCGKYVAEKKDYASETCECSTTKLKEDKFDEEPNKFGDLDFQILHDNLSAMRGKFPIAGIVYIVDLLESLDADASAPVFSVPIPFRSDTFHLVIDLDVLEPVARLSRVLFSIMMVLGITMLIIRQWSN